MKKLLFTFILTLASSYFFITTYRPETVAVVKEVLKQPCSEPIPYRIGNIDAKYGLSEQEFLKDINTSALVWDNIMGKKLFVYDPQALLSINLVYDERQALQTKFQDIKSQVDDNHQKLKPSEEKYSNLLSQFKKDMDNLNSQIESWNSKGGAPVEEFNKLTQQQNELKQRADQINQMGKDLNKSVDQYNQGVSELNKTVKNLEQTITQKPEEGIYDPNLNTINIYFIVNKNELIHTITHEMGHALGVDHNDNDASIMYPYTTTSITPSKDDVTSLQAICNNTLWERVQAKSKTVKFRTSF